MKSDYGVGVIGCGGMGTSHAGYFAALPDVEVVACADSVAPAAQQLAQQHDARAYTDPEELLDDPRVTIVAICTPTPLHADLIEASAQRAKHVFCEKPIARTLADARRAIDAAKDAGICLMIGHVLRFFPEYAMAKRLLDDGTVGRPAVVRTTRNSGYPRGAGDWFVDPDQSGGVMVDMVIHDLDFLLWCFGEAERIYCKALTYHGPEATDYALATVRFKSRVIAHIEGSWAHPPGTFFTKLEIAGDKGLLEYDSQAASPLQVWKKAVGDEKAPGVVVPESPLAESPYQIEICEFMDAVRTGRDPCVTPQDAYNALELALAALESALRGEALALPLAH
ncbi:MAG: Gfo/Idh/MocA family oxidoreductase [Armatimonadota bacterium]|nr:MAG: Gfo/Idh/MocA family oxidoreductase [Armatimonadota bacterium]